jgi:carboxyl-terminal processing protease
MIGKWQKSGLVGVGIAAGLLLGLNFSAIAQREARSPLPLPEIQALAEVFGNIKQGYVEPVEDKKLLTGAVKGMLTELDPHSAYLDPEENKEFETGIKGEFGGLGIEVGTEEGYVKVVSPIEDTPAFRAGIKANDLIVKIDDTSTKGISLNDAVKKMRGKPRTSIKLTVARKGENKPLEFTLMREVIKIQSVKAKVTEPGYAHLRITQFQEPTVADLARGIERVYKESNGKLSGIILDLRNNPGGLLHASIGVSAAFLEPKAVVVSSNGRLPDTKHEYLASPDEYAFRAREDQLRGLPASIKNVPTPCRTTSAPSSWASRLSARARCRPRSTCRTAPG